MLNEVYKSSFANLYTHVRLLMFLSALFCFVFVLGAAVAQAGEVEVQVSTEPVRYAWWLRVTFTPTHTNIRGIPVKEIHKAWRRASELKKQCLPRHLLYEDGADLMDQSQIAFSVAGDFNHDSRTKEALVGVYETDSGERGTFLLILSRSDSGSWHKVFLDEIPDGPGFSGLHWDGENLFWLHCMKCDASRYLVWDKNKKRYVWIPVKHGPD